MRLKSCDECGVVYDLSVVQPLEVYDENEDPTDDAVWDSEEFTWNPTFRCRICQNRIVFKPEVSFG